MKSTTKKENVQLNTEISSEEIRAAEIKTIADKAFKEATAVTWCHVEVGRTFTQDDKIALVDDKTLVIGADVGSEKHFIRAFDNRGREFSKKPLEFDNNEAGFETAKAWMFKIRDEKHRERVMVGMEPTGHYWFNLASWLMDEGITVVLVNPHHVKKTKELDDNLNRKTDRKDPKTIAGLVHEGRYSMPYLPEGIYAELRDLTSLRLRNTQEKTREMNRLKRWLSIHFPEFGGVFKSVDGAGSLLLLEKAPLPEDIINLGADGVNKIWREAKLRGVGYSRALKAVSAAKHTVGRTESPEAAREEIAWIIEDLKRYIQREESLMEKLDAVAERIPHITNILQIRGLGLRTVTGILAEIGDFKRFTEARQIQKLAGLALVEDSSGKHNGKTIISKRGRKHLRYLLYEASLTLIAMNDEFKEVYQYYLTRENNPLKKMQALMAVACKLLRVLYAMTTKGVKYDPAKLLGDIHRPKEKVA